MVWRNYEGHEGGRDRCCWYRYRQILYQNRLIFGQVKKLDAGLVSTTFAEDSFDFTVCSHVLEHLENPVEVLNQISKVTKGPIIIAVPNLARLTNFFLRKPSMLTRVIVRAGSYHLITMVENHKPQFCLLD